MLGRHHLSLSVATVALVVFPLFTLYPTAVLLALAGAAIGSLIPDADSPDAAIFHTEVRGMKKEGFSSLLNAAAALNPVFGYPTKFLIYKPAVKFYDSIVFNQYDIAERHRGFLHSFLGLGTMTILTAVYILPVLFLLELFWLVGIGVFLAGYLAGAVLHLIEDSCTKSGIQWNFPFQSWKLRGQISTTARPEDMRYQQGFLTVLGAGAGGMFFAPTIVTEISAILFSVVGLLLAIVLWSVFAVGVATCRLVPG